MVTTIKAIETQYNGYRFRSRVEARWARFFDALGVKYEYEKEGYDLGDAGWYLPDFWLPQLGVWVEIKGADPTENEKIKASSLADMTACPVILCSGTPGFTTENIDNLYILHRHDYGMETYFGYHVPPAGTFPWAHFTSGLRHSMDMLEEFLHTNFPPDRVPIYDGSRDSIFALIELDREYFQNKYGRPHQKWKYGIVDKVGRFSWKDGLIVDYDFHTVQPEIRIAFTHARSARFEHGENGL